MERGEGESQLSRALPLLGETKQNKPNKQTNNTMRKSKSRKGMKVHGNKYVMHNFVNYSRQPAVSIVYVYKPPGLNLIPG